MKRTQSVMKIVTLAATLTLLVSILVAQEAAAPKACCGTCGGGEAAAAAVPSCCASTGGVAAAAQPCCAGNPAGACGTGACGIQGCNGLGGIALYADSPTVLLGKAEALGLSDEQVSKIEVIFASARKQALAVLTPEQAGFVAKFTEPIMLGGGGAMAGCPGQAAMAATAACCPSQATAACGPGCTQPCCAAPAVGQTACPIMGLPINKKLSVEHAGKTVYFCCPGCIQKFKANPETYMSKLPQFQN
ncbi:YHS domain-containing protein [Planctomycetota bacterium]